MVDNNQLGFLGKWLTIFFCFMMKHSCKRHSFDLLNPFLVSDRDKNLLVYMYLPEGESFIWSFLQYF